MKESPTQTSPEKENSLDYQLMALFNACKALKIPDEVYQKKREELIEKFNARQREAESHGDTE